jgi:hypothetical protein
VNLEEVRASRSIDPDRLAELHEQRRFLLRSLADLEREHDAGDVDDTDYATLRDGYTARAAEVLRAIDAGTAGLAAPRRRRGRTLLVGVVVVAVAAGMGWFVAWSSGERTPGQNITGANPGDERSLLLVEARLTMAQDPARAFGLYSDVLAVDPDHAEALTYAGWTLVVDALRQGDDVLTERLPQAKLLIDRAIAVEPTYADPHCLLAIIAGNFEDDPDTAASEIEACRANDPPAEMLALIDQFAARVDGAD